MPHRLLPCLVAFALLFRAGGASAQWPSLDDIVRQARARAIAVVDAQGDVGVAAASGIGARVSSFNNPYLELQVDRGRHTQDVQVQGLLFVPIELMGQRGTRIEEANRLLAWREQGLLDVQSRAMGEAIAAYGEVLTASGQLEDAIRAEADAKNEVQHLTARLAVGDATTLDQSLAEAELSRWAQTRAQAKLHVIEARSRLLVVTGGGAVAEPPAGGAAALPALRSPWGDAVLGALVDGSPALRAVQGESGYWSASAARAERDKYPPISIIGLAGRGDLGEARFGGGLSWTLPVLRRNQGEIAMSRAQEQRARRARDALRRVIEVRLRTAHEVFTVSVRAAAEQEQTGLPASQRAVDAAIAAHRAGKGELLRVFIARRDLMTARGRRLELILSAWNAYAEMAALKGDIP